MRNGNSKSLAGLVLFVDHQHGIAEGACTADRKSVDEAASKVARAAQIYGNARSERAAILPMTQAGVEMTSVPTIVGEPIRDSSDPQTERVFPLLMS